VKKVIYIIIALAVIYIAFDIWSKAGRLTGKKFVAKYKHENWQIFKNRELYVRGYNNGNPIILLSHLYNTNPCCEVISFNKVSNTVDSVRSLDSDSWSTQLSVADSILILKFVSYGFRDLSVDSAGTVRIWIAQHTECPHLINFGNLKYKTKEYDQWTDLGDGWYEEKL